MALAAALVVCVLYTPVAHAQGAAPTFDSANYDREVAENTPSGQNVGAAVTASGGTGALTYSLTGPDSASFDIVATSGQIRTRDGVTYDHEAKSSYTVTVTATDTASMTAIATVAITVTDVDEPPLAPTQVYGAADHFTYDRIVVRWLAPDNTGRPAITGYEMQFKKAFHDWPDESQSVAGTETTITGIVPGFLHRLRVRARNSEGAGPWAVPGGLQTDYTTENLPDLPVVAVPTEIEPGFLIDPQVPGIQIIPPGLGPGDGFRLLFVSGPIVDLSSNGLFDAALKEPRDNYVEISQNSLGDVFGNANHFIFVDPVVSTQSFNARELSRTTYTEEDKGVPIYWVLGSKVADDYEDFWDGTWDDETNLRDQNGDLITVSNGAWTGSAADGTELIVNGVSHAMGEPQVGYGAPGAGPIHSGLTAANTEERHLYGLSENFLIVAPGLVSNIDQFNDYLYDLLDGIDQSLSDAEYRQMEEAIIAQYYADTSDSRTGMRAQRFTTGPHPNGYEQVGFQIGYTQYAPRGDYDLALYTVDASGHPDTKVVDMTYPSGDSSRQLTFEAPEATVLDPNTTYALVVVPQDSMTELSFDTTESDEEDDETAEGWSLADAFDIYSETDSSWSAHSGGRALLVRVRATPKAGAPGKPSTLTATASGRHRIDLSWTAPLNGGSEITGYRIESSSDGSTGWTDLVADTASTATSHSDTGLRPNTTRHYRVSAINALGASPASDPAFDTTGDFPEVTVQYGQSDYTVAEGGTLEVTVTLSEDPLQETVIPIAATGRDGATSADYSVPSSVTFGEGDTSKTITFAATDDTEDDDDESVLLSFGSVLPDRVSEGSPNEATVNIADDDDPHVTVMFAQADYVVVEGETVLVRVALSANPERTVVIPLTATNQGGASSTDYSGLPPSVTLSAGDTSRTFEFTASEDSFADTGESVKLGFGAMPDTRVSEGSPNEATVNIRQFSTEFTLDCSAAVWCADLQFSDQSQLDWGRARLERGDNRDPASALSDDSFSFRGVEYEVRGFRLRAGTYPTLANAWSREEQNRSKFVILITPAGQSSAPSRAHYRDWALHVDGLELPFKDAVNSQYGFFDWIDADIQQIFSDWTPTTVNRVGIQEVAAVDQPPSLAVPWLPMAVEAHGAGANELRVTWIPPLWHHRIPAPTGYIVQWKLASASWSTPAAVSQREVAGRHGRQVAIGGLAENTLYSVRGSSPSTTRATDRSRRTRWGGRSATAPTCWG